MLAAVETACPCAAATDVRSHRRCWKAVLDDGGAPRACRRALGRALRSSLCGRAGAVLCRQTNRRGTHTACRVVPARRCAERAGRRTACAGFTRCDEVCAADARCVATTPTTLGTSTSTTLVTSTTLPGTPVAVAGPDREVRRGASVTLAGGASSHPDGRALRYTWSQQDGPDVTAGAGVLDGVAPSFSAPADVSTLVFELVVSDGTRTSLPSTMRVWVMEEPARALFVDGDAGSDATGDGSRALPFASLPRALAAVDAAAPADVYVRTRAGGALYDYAGIELALPDGTSLYGGFGDGWRRDPTANRTRLIAGPVAVSIRAATADAWVSGFDITAEVAPGDAQVVTRVALAAAASPLATVWVWDATLRASGAPATPPLLQLAGAASIGLSASQLGGLDVRRCTITAGAGGPGARGGDGAVGATGAAGGDVAAGSFAGGTAGSGNTRAGTAGAKGGNGGTELFDAGQKGADTPTGAGGAGGTFPLTHGASAFPCSNAGLFPIDPPLIGTHGLGGAGDGTLAFDTVAASPGGNGGTGGKGFGGAGGGGGFANSGIDGGGGGGGGQGGGGGSGGGGASGGGPSIGVFLHDFAGETAPVTLRDNVITAGTGGEGGRGGNGGDFGPGGPGGDGGAGGSGALGLRGGNGGCGRAGSSGWWGGVGGGGGGGPSYALYVGPRIGAWTITGNLLAGGSGGRGGRAGSYSLGPDLNGTPSAGGGGLGRACFDGHVAALERVVCAAVAAGDNVIVEGSDGPPPLAE